MCKLFALTDTSNISKAQLAELLVRMKTRFLTVGQSHGFGYALQAQKGLVIERFVKPQDFTRVDSYRTDIETLGTMADYVDSPGYSCSSQTFEDCIPSGPLIVHGRTSTNDICIENTHPFEKNGWCLAHNGVVEKKRGNKHPVVTSCDSEHILNAYALDKGAESFGRLFTGYFATVAISPEGYLVVTRDNTASLYVAYSNTWQTFAFSTDDYAITALNDGMQAGFGRPFPVLPYHEYTFVASELRRASHFEIKKPRYMNAAAKTALGTTTTTTTTTTAVTQTPPPTPLNTVLNRLSTTQPEMKFEPSNDVDMSDVIASEDELIAQFGADMDEWPVHVWRYYERIITDDGDVVVTYKGLEIEASTTA